MNSAPGPMPFAPNASRPRSCRTKEEITRIPSPPVASGSCPAGNPAPWSETESAYSLGEARPSEPPMRPAPCLAALEIRPDDPVLAREMVVEWDFRREHVRVFELRLRAEPVLRIDNREIVAARFVDPQALLAEPVLPPFIRAYLGGAHPSS